jgi:DNA-binding transcriptional regulator YiaG
VTGEFSREHWIVPVRGLADADPDGIVQVIACPDGTVILNLTCGDTRTGVRIEICRAAQLSTGIWEAAGAAQQSAVHLSDGSPPPQLPNAPDDLPVAWRAHPHRNTAPRRSASRPQRQRASVNGDTARDATRMIGRRIRRIRKSRKKSLRVIAGLAGMSKSTLERVEQGRREPTLSEIVALAKALQIAPAELIILPGLEAPENSTRLRVIPGTR